MTRITLGSNCERLKQTSDPTQTKTAKQCQLAKGGLERKTGIAKQVARVQVGRKQVA